MVLSLGYDAAGRPASLTTPQGNLTFGYSATTGHLTSLASPGGVSQSFTYDGALPKTASWSGPVSGSVQLTHDADFRVTGLTVNAATNIAFGYDTDGLLTSAGALSLTRDAGNGLLTGTTLGSLTTSWAYDSLALTTSSSALSGATALFQTSYARDSLGRITTLTETIQGTTNTFAYTYDSSGRLSEVRLGGVLVASYAYDLNGNRVSRTTSGGTEAGSVDGQDRLLAYGAANYTYTANGELLTRIVGTDTTRYSYDVRGNLLSVRLPAGTLIAYVADGQNRRIQRSVNGVVTQGFLYQGQLAPVAELDASNQVVSRFVYATRVNVPDYLLKGGVTYRVLTDHLGSVRLVVNTSTGAVVQRLDYDEYGRVTLNTNPGFQPFGYAGGLVDEQTGLVRFGARDYDPSIGRWTAKDPIGFGGGSANVYAYADNEPVNLVDADGMEAEDSELLRDGADMAAGFVPVLSTGIDAMVAATGYNPITKQCVGGLDRSLALVGFVLPGVSGGQLRGAGKLVKRVSKLEKHHIFPVRFAKQFEGLIDINQHTMKLEKEVHRAIHAGGPRGGAWNMAWEEFFLMNPNFDVSDLYAQGQKLIRDFGISGPMTKY